MNKTIKIMISSALMIVLCLSLTIGSTYALFTQDDNVNIAVTSGRLAVKATLYIDEQYSPNNDGGVKTGWLSGNASTHGGNITLDNMAPGDGVKFRIVIASDSSVAIKWQVIITYSGDDELRSNLNISLGDEFQLVDTGSALVSGWNTLELDSNNAQTVTLSDCIIELDEVAAIMQTNSCAVTVTVYAVQANATTSDSEPGKLSVTQN